MFSHNSHTKTERTDTPAPPAMAGRGASLLWADEKEAGEIEREMLKAATAPARPLFTKLTS